MKKVKISLKRLTAQRLIYIQLIYNFFIKWGIAQFKLPGAMNYVTDVITVLLLIEILFHRINGYKPKTPIAPSKIAIAFFAYSIFNWAIHLYSPLYYLWGFRNTFRFFIFFAACSTFLEEDDIPKIINMIFWMFIATVLMCSYQYFVMEKRMDFIAGFFGNTETQGGNGAITILASLVCLTCVVQYIETRSFGIKAIIAILGAMYLATIAEIKLLFVLVVVIIALSSLFTRFSFKKFSIIAIIAIMMPVAIRILYELYPTFEDFFEMDKILEYASGEQGYIGHGGINRFNSIAYCMENFLESVPDKIFGLGLGAADGSSNFDVVTTEFYKENIDTNYNWFLVPIVLIENGLIGLVIFWMFYVVVLLDASKQRGLRGERKSYMVITQIFAIIMIYFSFHSKITRTEIIGYLCYTFLSFPYILRKR